MISYDAYDPDGIKRLEDKGVTDCIVGFRVPYIKGPDTEPLEKKIEHLERYAEHIIAQGRRWRRPDAALPGRGRGGRAADRDRADSSGPSRTCSRATTTSPAGSGPRCRWPSTTTSTGRCSSTPTHQFSRQGLDNPDAIYFNAYLTRGRRVRRPRPPRHHRRPVLPGDGRHLLRRLGAPTSLPAFDDRELEMAADGTSSARFGADAGREDADRARGLQRLGHRGARHALDRAHRHRRPTGPAAAAGAAREALRDRRQAAHRLDPDLVRLPALLPVPGAGQHPDRRRSRRPAAWRRSAPRSATTSWPTTRRWSSPSRSAPTAPTRRSRSARTGTSRPTTRPTRPRSPRPRRSPTPTA